MEIDETHTPPPSARSSMRMEYEPITFENQFAGWSTPTQPSPAMSRAQSYKDFSTLAPVQQTSPPPTLAASADMDWLQSLKAAVKSTVGTASPKREPAANNNTSAPPALTPHSAAQHQAGGLSLPGSFGDVLKSATASAPKTPSAAHSKPLSKWTFDFDPPLKHQQRSERSKHLKDTASSVGALTPPTVTGRFQVSATAAAPAPTVRHTMAPPHEPSVLYEPYTPQHTLVSMASDESPSWRPAGRQHAPTTSARIEHTTTSSTTTVTPPVSSPQEQRPSRRGSKEVVQALDLATAIEAIDRYTSTTGRRYSYSRTLPRMPSTAHTSSGAGTPTAGGVEELQSLFVPPSANTLSSPAAGGRSRGMSTSGGKGPGAKKPKQPFIPL